EDGIRDYKVTGVQTCALPICLRPRLGARRALHGGGALLARDAPRVGSGGRPAGRPDAVLAPARMLSRGDGFRRAEGARDADHLQIGRASCRESASFGWDSFYE